VTVGLLLHAGMGGPQAAFLSEMFPTRYRYSGVSLAYQLTSIVAGSLAPIIALAILQSTHSAFGVSLYVGAGGLVSFAAPCSPRDPRQELRRDRRGGLTQQGPQPCRRGPWPRGPHIRKMLRDLRRWGRRPPPLGCREGTELVS
jgi:MFS family permease